MKLAKTCDRMCTTGTGCVSGCRLDYAYYNKHHLNGTEHDEEA